MAERKFGIVGFYLVSVFLLVEGNYVNENRSVKTPMKAISSYDAGFNNATTDADPKQIFHWAYVEQRQGEYRGAEATMSVYGLPEVGDHQSSSVALYIANGDGPNFNSIMVGSQVCPSLYGDQEPHFFISWNVNGKECVNLDSSCNGFVLSETTEYVPGSLMHSLSTYDGPQNAITFKILQDAETLDWLLYFNETNGVGYDKFIGSWENSVVTGLADVAAVVRVGGIVGYYEGDTGPPMGSGHFPVEGPGRAAFVENIQVVLKDHTTGDLALDFFENRPDCYKISRADPLILFGGPGGCKG